MSNLLSAAMLSTAEGQSAHNGVDVPTSSFTIRSESGGMVTGQLGDGRTAVMPISEFYPHEAPVEGDSWMCTVVTGGAKPIVSVIRPELIPSVYATVVPELRSGQVRVMGVVRVPGVRAKLSVATTDPTIDAVAACIGRDANRVRFISGLLNGERIDIVGWDPDPARYVAAALAPASVLDVTLDLEAGVATVLVANHQMPAAVGVGGSNTHLASELVGCQIEVVSS